jgi:outer membrane protein assembly factor BamB
MDFINDWTYWQYSGVVYAEGKLFVGTGGPGFRCIDPDTRATIWDFNFSTYYGTTYRSGTCSPAYDNGRLYFTTRDGAFFCLNASDGSVAWHQRIPGIRQNTVLLTDQYVYNVFCGGGVQCRNRSDGSLVWTQSCSGVTDGNLAICGEVLIVPGDGWKLWGLDYRTGRPLWCTKLTGNFARSSPYVICGKVYISACHGDYYGLDGQTGKIEWRYRHGAELSFVEWAEDSGQVFVCNSAGKMYCFKAEVPGNSVTCVCDLKGDWSPVPTAMPTWTPSMTPTPVGTLTGDCSGQVCRVSSPDQVKVLARSRLHTTGFLEGGIRNHRASRRMDCALQ